MTRDELTARLVKAATESHAKRDGPKEVTIKLKGKTERGSRYFRVLSTWAGWYSGPGCPDTGLLIEVEEIKKPKKSKKVLDPVAEAMYQDATHQTKKTN